MKTQALVLHVLFMIFFINQVLQSLPQEQDKQHPYL